MPSTRSTSLPLGEPGSEAFRNPLIERSYRESDLLTPSFKEHVDGLLDEEDGLRTDPFLLAQDIPSEFSEDPGLTEDSAVAHLQFGTNAVKHLQ
ncbi:MAG: hypothetical protein U5K99_05140 [Anaerolineales bacterium]|nr:hypothetical protein [Anaerolineales bacterium]